jgi:membrane protein DedA with SNARE-associated domain
MNHWVITHLNYFFEHYGYWTVFFGILLENAGIPLPGETILIVASVLARTKHELSIADVAVIAVLAAITGDNLGFALGRYGGRPLLDRYRHVFHIEKETVRKAESLFTRRGGMAVFFARFITGLRVVAGPMAGALRMHPSLFFGSISRASVAPSELGVRRCGCASHALFVAQEKAQWKQIASGNKFRI